MKRILLTLIFVLSYQTRADEQNTDSFKWQDKAIGFVEQKGIFTREISRPHWNLKKIKIEITVQALQSIKSLSEDYPTYLEYKVEKIVPKGKNIWVAQGTLAPPIQEDWRSGKLKQNFWEDSEVASSIEKKGEGRYVIKFGVGLKRKMKKDLHVPINDVFLNVSSKSVNVRKDAVEFFDQGKFIGKSSDKNIESLAKLRIGVVPDVMKEIKKVSPKDAGINITLSFARVEDKSGKKIQNIKWKTTEHYLPSGATTLKLGPNFREDIKKSGYGKYKVQCNLKLRLKSTNYEIISTESLNLNVVD